MSTEIKNLALSRLSGRWGISWLLLFVSGIVSSFAGFIPLGSLIIAGPIALGLAGYFLKVSRGENASIEDLFAGFKNFLNAFLAMLLMMIFMVIGFVLLIVPGIIVALGLSQTFNIMHHNPTMSSVDCLKESWERMKGRKGDYFVFCLSFIGWFLLILLPLAFCFTALFEAAKSGVLGSATSSPSPLQVLQLGMSVAIPVLVVVIASYFVNIYFYTSCATWYDTYINPRDAQLEEFGTEVKQS
ncbi:MAG: hypothetical protein RL660_2094 [Bacteroidota bacterium]|jgi:uncharacterized membrane protein